MQNYSAKYSAKENEKKTMTSLIIQWNKSENMKIEENYATYRKQNFQQNYLNILSKAYWRVGDRGLKAKNLYDGTFISLPQIRKYNYLQNKIIKKRYRRENWKKDLIRR